VRCPVIPAWINPLQCPEIDLEPATAPPPNAHRLHDYLVAPEKHLTREAFVTRLREIAARARTLFKAPNEPTILERLVWPPRHAKGRHSLANYLGAIALCGMVAILLWDISKVTFTRPMTDAGQRSLLGDTFDKLGQVFELVQILSNQDKSANGKGCQTVQGRHSQEHPGRLSTVSPRSSSNKSLRNVDLFESMACPRDTLWIPPALVLN